MRFLVVFFIVCWQTVSFSCVNVNEADEVMDSGFHLGLCPLLIYCGNYITCIQPSHAVCFERPGEPGYSSVLSTGVHGCSWFSLGFAVSFDSVGEFHKLKRSG